MSDQIQIQIGSDPWQPTSDAELAAVFHFHDVPLVGHIVQHGCDYVFTCILGHGGPASLWAYVPVSRSELDVLATASGLEINESFPGAFAAGPVTVALANADLKITLSFVVAAANNGRELFDLTMIELERAKETVETAGRELRDAIPA